MRVRKTILTLVILAFCLGAGWIALNWRAALAETRAELESVAVSCQAQLDEKNRVIQQLQAEVQQARMDGLHTAAAFKAKAEALESQLSQQANVKSPAPTKEPSGVVLKEKRLEAIRVMREHLHALDAETLKVRRQARDLSTSLMVPDEIAAMDPGKALDMAGLNAYWPFFEAKRERERLEKSTEDLKRRVIMEEVELALPR